jgi:hypothetical protein
MWKTGAGLAGLLLGLILLGCGSSGESTETAAAPSKAVFIREADAICKKGDAKIQQDFRAFGKEHGFSTGGPSDQEGEELVHQVLLPNLEKQADQIRALGAPSGDEEQIAAILEALEEGIEEVDAKPKHVFNGSTDPFREANELAAEYGMKVCGEG